MNEQRIIKAQKLGDFYEFIGEPDARIAAEVLEVTLTKHRASGEPMAGIPAHSVMRYVSAANAKNVLIEFAPGEEPPEIRYQRHSDECNDLNDRSAKEICICKGKKSRKQ